MMLSSRLEREVFMDVGTDCRSSFIAKDCVTHTSIQIFCSSSKFPSPNRQISRVLVWKWSRSQSYTRVAMAAVAKFRLQDFPVDRRLLYSIYKINGSCSALIMARWIFLATTLPAVACLAACAPVAEKARPSPPLTKKDDFHYLCSCWIWLTDTSILDGESVWIDKA